MKLLCLVAGTDTPALTRSGDCENIENHTPSPDSYLAFGEWAQKMNKTHRQIRCAHCGRWAIWVPRRKANEEE